MKPGDKVKYKVGALPHYVERELTVIERNGELALQGDKDNQSYFVWVKNAYGTITPHA